MTHYSWRQRLTFIPPVALGILVLILAPAIRSDPAQAPVATNKKVVRVLPVEPRAIRPVAIGYGHTRPVREWSGQSQVDGEVIWVAEQFHVGSVIGKGQEILRLDPSLYQLTLARLEAETEVLVLTQQAIMASLNIAEQDYQVQQSEYKRILRLRDTGHVSLAEAEQAQRALLASKQQLQTHKNNLAINLAQQKVLRQERLIAERDLQHTRIKAPYSMRVTDKFVGLADYVNKGEVMLQADNIDAVEVDAQFALGKMRPLRQAEGGPVVGEIPSRLQAEVELAVDGRIIRWQAEVRHSGGRVDAQTQSQTIVVRVNHPFQQAVPGERPPLLRDTFVRVRLMAPPLEKRIVLPVSALHSGSVYVISKGKLAQKAVSVDFIQEQVAVIRSGLKAGDHVVLSQLEPAVSGMPVSEKIDTETMHWLDAQTGLSVDSQYGGL